jgi:hypothetical protein
MTNISFDNVVNSNLLSVSGVCEAVVTVLRTATDITLVEWVSEL